jgi:hypothetical protein
LNTFLSKAHLYKFFAWAHVKAQALKKAIKSKDNKKAAMA